MTELVGSWLHFTPRQPKRKRAEAVCIYCHSKKVKCDLEVLHHPRSRAECLLILSLRVGLTTATANVQTVRDRTGSVAFVNRDEASNGRLPPSMMGLTRLPSRLRRQKQVSMSGFCVHDVLYRP